MRLQTSLKWLEAALQSTKNNCSMPRTYGTLAKCIGHAEDAN